MKNVVGDKLGVVGGSLISLRGLRRRRGGGVGGGEEAGERCKSGSTPGTDREGAGEGSVGGTGGGGVGGGGGNVIGRVGSGLGMGVVDVGRAKKAIMAKKELFEGVSLYQC